MLQLFSGFRCGKTALSHKLFIHVSSVSGCTCDDLHWLWFLDDLPEEIWLQQCGDQPVVGCLWLAVGSSPSEHLAYA